APATFPGYQYRSGLDQMVDRWNVGSGADQRQFELILSRIRETNGHDGPLLLLGDHRLQLSVTYATPRRSLGYVPGIGGMGEVMVTNETVALAPVSEISPHSIRQERLFRKREGEILSIFWWPAEPKGPTAGYTAPVQAWVETRITGLTSRPLILRSEWSPTYHPGHHNFYEAFAFAPRLDPAVPADRLAELESANIKAIVIGSSRDEFPPPTWFVWGVDDRFRPF